MERIPQGAKDGDAVVFNTARKNLVIIGVTIA
jgi:hypothetical protein